MALFSDEQIIESWLLNAKPWIAAIDRNEIQSRSLITNSAIIDTILKKSPETVLDIGCGEGWLSRELARSKVYTHGIDVVPELISYAKEQGQGTFQLVSYEELSAESFKQKYDVIVCNFSLLGDQSVENVFKCIPHLLNKHGFFIVQTIHPVTACGDAGYECGWRKGSWKGFSQYFTNPAPWYFRTLESWKNLFEKNGLLVCETLEPFNPETNKYASIIFTAKLSANMLID